MPNAALIPRAATKIEPLTTVVDGYPDVVHRLETITGGEPLEDGRSATDHAIARQDRVTLTGFVSDWSGGERPRTAWQTIRRLQKAIETLDVVTEWGVYREMIIHRAVARYAGRGQRFELELREILRVGVTDRELAEGTTSGPAASRAGEIERGRVASVGLGA